VSIVTLGVFIISINHRIFKQNFTYFQDKTGVFTDEVRGLLENYNTIVSFISVKFVYCIISEGYGI
jgi:hypothetical protein